jgi:hypothetical protein
MKSMLKIEKFLKAGKKKIALMLLTAMIGFGSFAQKDSTADNKRDTISIGGMRIIFKNKNRGNNDTLSKRGPTVYWGKNNKKKKNVNLSTNWLIFDVGFNGFEDNTNYATAVPSTYLPTGINAASFKTTQSKSINLNIWAVMQKYNLYKHYLNLKYGVGLEINNYRYTSNVSYRDQPITRVFSDSMQYSKNKLALTYLTVPLMLNFNATPNKKGLRLSAGLSAGYLIGAKNKQESNVNGKKKNRGDFDLNKFRTSIIGEIGISRLTLYGSYSLQNIHKNKLEQAPYSIGFRLSSW